MRIGVTGASGMLGSALINELIDEHKVFATSRTKGHVKTGVEWECFDLTNSQYLNQWMVDISPDMIIHCAAIVDVDACEDNIELAKKLHIDSTKTMVNYLNSNNKRLIYISTDSVFDGKKDGLYNESDKANPLNVYSETKFLGELPVLTMKNGLVLRTNIIGWTRSGDMSFSEWVLDGLIKGNPLSLFDDVIFSPLNVIDLSKIIRQIIDNEIYGLYHCASKDSISKYDFGIKMAEIFNLSIDNIKKISFKDIKLKANRPKNMALNSNKLSSILPHEFPIVVDAIKIMKNQYDNGYVL